MQNLLEVSLLDMLFYSSTSKAHVHFYPDFAKLKCTSGSPKPAPPSILNRSCSDQSSSSCWACSKKTFSTKTNPTWVKMFKTQQRMHDADSSQNTCKAANKQDIYKLISLETILPKSPASSWCLAATAAPATTGRRSQSMDLIFPCEHSTPWKPAVCVESMLGTSKQTCFRICAKHQSRPKSWNPCKFLVARALASVLAGIDRLEPRSTSTVKTKFVANTWSELLNLYCKAFCSPRARKSASKVCRIFVHRVVKFAVGLDGGKSRWSFPTLLVVFRNISMATWRRSGDAVWGDNRWTCFSTRCNRNAACSFL